MESACRRGCLLAMAALAAAASTGCDPVNYSIIENDTPAPVSITYRDRPWTTIAPGEAVALEPLPKYEIIYRAVDPAGTDLGCIVFQFRQSGPNRLSGRISDAIPCEQVSPRTLSRWATFLVLSAAVVTIAIAIAALWVLVCPVEWLRRRSVVRFARTIVLLNWVATGLFIVLAVQGIRHPPSYDPPLGMILLQALVVIVPMGVLAALATLRLVRHPPRAPIRAPIG